MLNFFIYLKITGEGRKRNQISVGSCSEVTLPGVVTDADLRSLNASIQVIIFFRLSTSLIQSFFFSAIDPKRFRRTMFLKTNANWKYWYFIYTQRNW